MTKNVNKLCVSLQVCSGIFTYDVTLKNNYFSKITTKLNSNSIFIVIIQLFYLKIKSRLLWKVHSTLFTNWGLSRAQWAIHRNSDSSRVWELHNVIIMCAPRHIKTLDSLVPEPEWPLRPLVIEIEPEEAPRDLREINAMILGFGILVLLCIVWDVLFLFKIGY